MLGGWATKTECFPLKRFLYLLTDQDLLNKSESFNGLNQKANFFATYFELVIQDLKRVSEKKVF